MKLYLLRFPEGAAYHKSQLYSCRKLAEFFGRSHSSLHVIEEIEVSPQDPLYQSVFAMREYAAQSAKEHR